jgi:hypothetical protein
MNKLNQATSKVSQASLLNVIRMPNPRIQHNLITTSIKRFEQAIFRVYKTITRSLGQMYRFLGSISRTIIAGFRIETFIATPIVSFLGFMSFGILPTTLAAVTGIFRWFWNKVVALGDAMLQESISSALRGATVGGQRAFGIAFRGLLPQESIEHLLDQFGSLQLNQISNFGVLVRHMLHVKLGKDTSNAVVAYILAFQKVAKSFQKNVALQIAKKSGLVNTEEDENIFMILRNASTEEVSQAISKFMELQAQFNPGEAQAALITFVLTVKTFWFNIEATFGKALGKAGIPQALTKVIEALTSGSVKPPSVAIVFTKEVYSEGLIYDLMHLPVTKDFIHYVEGELDRFAKWMEETSKDHAALNLLVRDMVRSFERGIITLTGLIDGFADFMKMKRAPGLSDLRQSVRLDLMNLKTGYPSGARYPGLIQQVPSPGLGAGRETVFVPSGGGVRSLSGDYARTVQGRPWESKYDLPRRPGGRVGGRAGSSGGRVNHENVPPPPPARIPRSPAEAPETIDDARKGGFLGPQAPIGHIPESKGGAAYLAERRAPFRKELENPQTRELVAAVISAENAGAETGVVESLMNRTELVNQGRARKGLPPLTLRDMILGHPSIAGGKSFYNPVRNGSINSHLARIRNDKEYRDRLNSYTNQALAGSNRIEFYTDQGSSRDPNYYAGGVGININKERFNYWTWPGAREFREQGLREYEKASRSDKTYPGTGVGKLPRFTTKDIARITTGDASGVENIPRRGPGKWSDLPTAPGHEGRFNPGTVDADLREALSAARDQFEARHPGYRIAGWSGRRKTGGPHGTQAGAIDMTVIRPDGHEIPNEGRDSTGAYTEFARLVLGEMAARHPNRLPDLNWGGFFNANKGPGVSNPATGDNNPDLMHFDMQGRWHNRIGITDLLRKMGTIPGIKYGEDPTKKQVEEDPGAKFRPKAGPAIVKPEPAPYAGGGVPNVIQPGHDPKSLNLDVGPREISDDIPVQIFARNTVRGAQFDIQPIPSDLDTSGRYTARVNAAINAAADREGINRDFMYSIAEVESSGRPGWSTGSYHGLFQLSHEEFRKYGDGGDILNAMDNATAAARKIKKERQLLSDNLGREVTDSEAYMAHQQGYGGAALHIKNPNKPAWETMHDTPEGKTRGERWAKSTIWGNLTPSQQAEYKRVENITSGDFIRIWRVRYSKISGKVDPATIKAYKESYPSTFPGTAPYNPRQMWRQKPNVDMESAHAHTNVKNYSSKDLEKESDPPDHDHKKEIPADHKSVHASVLGSQSSVEGAGTPL